MEVAHLIFQPRVEEGFDEIVKWGLKDIIVIIMNGDDGKPTGNGAGRNDASEGNALLSIHREHETKDFCATEMEEGKVNIGKTLVNFAQVFVEKGISGDVGGKSGVIAAGVLKF